MASRACMQEGGWQGHRSGTAQYRGGEDQGPAGVCVCVSLSLALSSSHPTQGFGVGDNTHLYVMYMDCSCNTAIFTFFFLFGDVQALLSCPTSSIHTEEPPKDILQVQNMFPLPIDDKLLPVCMFVMFRAFISADTILKTHLGQHRTW
jgi:hypothetical protein